MTLVAHRQALVRAGKGATLLVHEATFAACLQHHATAKRHCTVDEALQTGSLDFRMK